MEDDLFEEEAEELLEDGAAKKSSGHEGAEMPVLGERGFMKPKRISLKVGLLVLLALIVIVLYVSLNSDYMSFETESQESSFGTRKMEEKIVEYAESDQGLKETVTVDLPAVQGNAVPTISGIPVTSVQVGTLYSFMPTASDEDSGDRRTFFIANQPPWTSFDAATGVLTGTPDNDDMGAYEGIVILVSDGMATAALPAFDITVTDADAVSVPEKGKGLQEQEVEATKAEEEAKKMEEGGGKAAKINESQYVLPNLTHLIKQSKFQKAALAYREHLSAFPETYSIKLEVNCLDSSVQTAFQQGGLNPMMLILPKRIDGKACFVVFWGLYSSRKEAREALSSVPPFFKKQTTRPELVLIRQYL